MTDWPEKMVLYPDHNFQSRTNFSRKIWSGRTNFTGNFGPPDRNFRGPKFPYTCNNYGLADVRISRQAYFCSLDCTVIWPLRHFVYCSIGYILPTRKLPWTKIIEHILCSTIARVEKYNNCRINLVFSAENEGLSSTRQVVLHTVRGPTCIELVFY